MNHPAPGVVTNADLDVMLIALNEGDVPPPMMAMWIRVLARALEDTRKVLQFADGNSVLICGHPLAAVVGKAIHAYCDEARTAVRPGIITETTFWYKGTPATIDFYDPATAAPGPSWLSP